MESIVDHFEKYFEIIYADTPELLNECRRLRYQTFCIEKHYIARDLHDNSYEVDEFDFRSANSLILHKDSGIYAATVRLILPSIQNIDAQFPMETHLTGNCLVEYNRLMRAPRENLAEISRFLISRDFRQRIGENNSVHGLSSDFGMLSTKVKRQFAAQISLGLFKAIVKMSAMHNIYYWLALMEPGFIRLLSRIGVCFNHLSESINMRGDRHVCFENSAEILLGGQRQRPDIWEFVTDGGHTHLPHMLERSSRSSHADTRERALP